jgi:hypothetical protein
MLKNYSFQDDRQEASGTAIASHHQLGKMVRSLRSRLERIVMLAIVAVGDKYPVALGMTLVDTGHSGNLGLHLTSAREALAIIDRYWPHYHVEIHESLRSLIITGRLDKVSCVAGAVCLPRQRMEWSNPASLAKTLVWAAALISYWRNDVRRDMARSTKHADEVRARFCSDLTATEDEDGHLGQNHPP